MLPLNPPPSSRLQRNLAWQRDWDSGRSAACAVDAGFGWFNECHGVAIRHRCGVLWPPTRVIN